MKTIQHKQGQERIVPKKCLFCAEELASARAEDAENLRRFTSSHSKILPRKKTGICAKHQRALARAIKQARELGYLGYTGQ